MAELKELKLFRKLTAGEHVTVVAFGSSNTQRYLPGMTWFDYVEMGMKLKFGGGCGNFINAGISGETTRQLLDRIDRDVLNYRPDLVILTVGGNDSNPNRNLSHEEYRNNLLEIHRRITEAGADVLFQTYYACKLDELPGGMGEKMNRNMQIVREIAAETHSLLMDHYLRWNRLKESFPEAYDLLMLNAMHVNADGNSVMGLNLLRLLAVELKNEVKKSFTAGFLGLHLIDAVNGSM